LSNFAPTTLCGSSSANAAAAVPTCEGRADDTAHNADALTGELKDAQFRMVTGPIGKGACRAALAQMAYKIAIRVEDADGRNLDVA
jgi:hypothetical protein